MEIPHVIHSPTLMKLGSIVMMGVLYMHAIESRFSIIFFTLGGAR